MYQRDLESRVYTMKQLRGKERTYEVKHSTPTDTELAQKVVDVLVASVFKQVFGDSTK